MRIIYTALFLFWTFFSARAQYANLRFENFSTMEGLSSSTCLEVFQDSDGFLWFGTIDGLNKFDGYDFQIYRPAVNDPNSISNNRVNSIVEDGAGRLWVGTSNGLNIFDKATQKFYRVKLNPDRVNSSTNPRDVINVLLYDQVTNMLWVGTRNGAGKLALDSMGVPSDYRHLTFVQYVSNEHDERTLSHNDVSAIMKDPEGKVWIGTGDQYLNLYQPETDDFQRLKIDVSGAFELDHIPKVMLVDRDGDFWIGNDLSRLVFRDVSEDRFEVLSLAEGSIPVFHMYQDRQGMLWIATDGYGLYLLEKGKGIIQHFMHNPAHPFSLPNDQPSRVLEDKDGLLWIATYNRGVSKLDRAKSSFGHYFYQTGKPDGLSTKIAQSVMEDSKKRIWIGTDGGGLNRFDEKRNTFRHFRANPGDASAISSDKILYLHESHDGTIWVCTWDGGLSRFDPGTGRAVNYTHRTTDPFSIGQNTVWCAVEDSLHRLWLGTQTAGLNMFDPRSGRFYSYTMESGTSGLISNFVFSLYRDSKNRLFVGTSLGLCVVELDELKDDVPKEIAFREVKGKNIQGNRINYLTEDHAGNIWTGTDLGLHKLGPDLDLLETYSTREGLPNNLIVGIAEDNNNNLWVTTKSGLSRLDPRTGDLKNFNVSDGLQGMEFQSKSIEKTHDGRILVGGINGFNIFDPDKLYMGADSVRPILTELRLFNRAVQAGDTISGRVLLNTSMADVEELELKYDEGYISFSFVALHYQNPGRVSYAYRMVGLDDDFIYGGSNKTANYSSVPPGDYTFEVKASLDGVWRTNVPVTSVRISVSPPPWKTWWAYTSYVAILVLILWAGMWYYTKVVREEKEREHDQMKLRFFINVSHEFRTPLTLILNPVDKILSAYNDPEEVKASAQTIQRSARRLLNLVNQLLDFRKMDLGKTPLEVVKGDIARFSKDIFILFEDLAQGKGIEFQFESTDESIPALFDPDKVEKIITNLLSNAIKFTETGGSVTFSVSSVKLEKRLGSSKLLRNSKLTNYVELVVKDTGRGFKKEQMKEVFSRFFHVDNTRTGTGIGLNFTRGLVELHGGEIFVESEYGKGSRFVVRLPLEVKPGRQGSQTIGEEDLKEYDFDLNAIRSTEYEIAITGDSEVDTLEVDESENGGKRPVVLVVEDNRELRLQLKKELGRHFKVREAVNGVEGFSRVMKYYPDLVISDVMMPEMDGFELCRKVKTDIETCHIPVILLTARSLEEDRIEGYNEGADEYLPKPFNINVLKARIRNLLEARRRLREKFGAVGGLLPSNELTTNSLDEAFLDKATKLILDNVSDQDFRLENLLKELGVSRSHFYRKISTLTGQNPSNFIRTIRLKYARELLMKNQYSIKEIAYMSGFNSSAYFTKTFRELYGKAPNQFMADKSDDNT